MIIVIAAISKNRVISSHDKIPWYIKADLNHFKSITSGCPIIMGRRTADTLPQALKNRLNIAISRSGVYERRGFICKKSIKEAIDKLNMVYKGDIFIIGGASIYKQSMKCADKLIISEIPIKINDHFSNLFFPKISKIIWKLEKSEQKEGFLLKEYVKRWK